MADEKKEEKSAEAAAQVPQEAAAQVPQETAPATAPAAEAAKAEAAPQAAAPAPAKEEKKEAAPVKKERPANCAGCNKSIKKKRWYYRDGKFYCTKRCWTSAKKKAEKPQETAPVS